MNLTKSAIALSMLVLAAGIVRAEPITLGQNILGGPGNTVFAGGTLVASNSVAVTSMTFTGTARSDVYRTAGGTLDFYYQFSNSGPADIGRLSFFNFDGFTTNVFNITNGSAVSGFLTGTADSSAVDRGASATINSVGFNYAAGAFGPGVTSLPLLISTNATNFMAGTFSVINGSTSTTATFAPAAAVPDAGSSIGLLALGLAAVAGVSRRFRR